MWIPLAAGAGALGALGVFIARKPDTYRVERSVVVRTTPEKAYAFFSDFHNFPRWSPWQKLDPNMQTTYGGAAAGRGAIYEWNGDKNVGAGRMEIVDAEEGRRVAIDLQFLRPFASRSATEWIAEPADGGTRVRWVMNGTNNFMAKAFGLFMNIEAMLAQNFDDGLANLKRELEG